MRVTRHGQDRAQERMGVDMRRFAALLRSQGLELPRDGKLETSMGTLIIEDGALVTVLSPDMVTARRAR